MRNVSDKSRMEYQNTFYVPFILENCAVYAIIIIIIIIGTTAPFEPRSSSEASASCPYSLHHSSNFSPPNFLPSSITPSSHLSFGLPLCLLPSS
jgi:hypothetical protein